MSDFNFSVNTLLNPYRKENDIMKAKLHKLIGTAVLGLALLLNSIPAWAGYVSDFPVFVTTKSASGSLTGARYSADSTQYIGCDSHSPSTASSVYCSAQDSAGKSLYCFSTDPRFVDAVKAMTDSSHIYFAAASYGGACTELTVTNDSVYLR
jgi:hypothetical protein